MENRWLLIWLLAPVFSPGAMAVEACSLYSYGLDADIPPAPRSSRAASSVAPLSIGATLLIVVSVVALTLSAALPAAAQIAPKTLVAVFAHADDEGPSGPILARYAREGARVYVVIATDGAQGGSHTSIPRGPELARVRNEEARCSTDALRIQPPILLGFPDAQLRYLCGRSRTPLPPDAATARGAATAPSRRADHVGTRRRHGASGPPAREQRRDAACARRCARRARASVLRIDSGRGDACHEPVASGAGVSRTAGEVFQHASCVCARRPRSRQALDVLPPDTGTSDDVVQRVSEAQGRMWNGTISFVPFVATDAGTDLFQSR